MKNLCLILLMVIIVIVFAHKIQANENPIQSFNSVSLFPTAASIAGMGNAWAGLASPYSSNPASIYSHNLIYATYVPLRFRKGPDVDLTMESGIINIGSGSLRVDYCNLNLPTTKIMVTMNKKLEYSANGRNLKIGYGVPISNNLSLGISTSLIHESEIKRNIITTLRRRYRRYNNIKYIRYVKYIKHIRRIRRIRSTGHIRKKINHDVIIRTKIRRIMLRPSLKNNFFTKTSTFYRFNDIRNTQRNLQIGALYRFNDEIRCGAVYEFDQNKINNRIVNPRGAVNNSVTHFSSNLYRFGISANPWKGGTFAMDCLYSKMKKVLFIGLEQYLNPCLAIRAGMDNKGVTCGLGLRWKNISIDYAYKNLTNSASSCVMTLTFSW